MMIAIKEIIELNYTITKRGIRLSERDCDNCDCDMYCNMDSCINDLEESEDYYRNQEIIEGLNWLAIE